MSARRLALVALALCLCISVRGADRQWSVQLRGYVSPENGKAPTAWMQVDSACTRIRAVVVGQHNMCEETLFGHPRFREAMAAEGIATIWITPIFEMVWDERNGCRAIFDRMLEDLAAVSGHAELTAVPVVPVGHSALATFPWNFAAWNPDRTLAVVSYHGDAPRTNLTGYGRENIEWGRTRNIDGIPALMVMGEYEWWEARLLPAMAFRMMYPESCISLLADVGRGHFDVADRTAEYIALFIAKAADKRIDGDSLRRLDPRDGFLADRWRPESSRRPKPAPAVRYKGDSHEAFWYFDREMAELTERIYAEERGKRMRYIGWVQNGELLPYDEHHHARIETVPDFEADSETFRLRAVFTDASHMRCADEKGAIRVRRICGPVEVIDDTTFRVRYGRGTYDNPRRGSEIWLAAESPADRRSKGAVQQILVRLPRKND